MTLTHPRTLIPAFAAVIAAIAAACGSEEEPQDTGPATTDAGTEPIEDAGPGIPEPYKCHAQAECPENAPPDAKFCYSGECWACENQSCIQLSPGNGAQYAFVRLNLRAVGSLQNRLCFAALYAVTQTTADGRSITCADIRSGAIAPDDPTVNHITHVINSNDTSNIVEIPNCSNQMPANLSVAAGQDHIVFAWGYRKSAEDSTQLGSVSSFGCVEGVDVIAGQDVEGADIGFTMEYLE